MNFAPTSQYMITDDDVHLFNEGRHFHLYRKLGSHLSTLAGQEGVYFSVWAPNARRAAVIGDFNGWNPETHMLEPVGQSGIWQGFISEARKGDNYKFHIVSQYNSYRVDKADPLAFYSENAPKTASVVWDLDYDWQDDSWMQKRRDHHKLDQPFSIYEVHLGSWARKSEDGSQPLTYRELAEKLPAYVKEKGFTHVEFLPVMEHPFYGSWGYQTTGYFAPTSRYGTPQDFKYLVDQLHQHEIGVILDWVPSHFPNDEHGLSFFDGTNLYEHQDPRLGFHPDWKSAIFNYGRNEVRSFLISSALFWLEEYHADGIRVDAVASMLYLDYSRNTGEWIPNRYGGRENLEAIEFLRQLNTAIYEFHPDVQTFAEESTAWPMVSRPTYLGGLGFGMKWDMGWMHDTLLYFSNDPIYRKYHQNDLSFRMIYAFNENFVLPLSHDEVVHGKGSLLNKMPGDHWQKFANLRATYAYMFASPGKKLLFMGGEFGQWNEWGHERSLDWHLCEEPNHQGISQLITDLNKLYKDERALHEGDFDSSGFSWIDASDSDNSVFAFLRKSSEGENIVVVMNLTPMVREEYRVGLPQPGIWEEVLNTDASVYGGSGVGNMGQVSTLPVSWHGHYHSAKLTLPPAAVIYLKWKGEDE